jgi:AGZA family xanthine/uracil permease-like MFS transporter
MTFFGFMHGEAIGVGQTPLVAISYLGVAAILVGCAKFATTTAAPEEAPAIIEHGVVPGE